MSTLVNAPVLVGGGRLLDRLVCALVGHEVDNFQLGMQAGARRCRCRRAYLAEDSSETRIRHTLSCFLLGHVYTLACERAGYREYVCTRCGHPLLFDSACDPYAGWVRFEKRVRYRCNLFGHEVKHVADRRGLREYACACGHTFLRPLAGLVRITHPLICLLAGHFVRYVESRGGYSEFVCRNCGHPFCFAAPESAAGPLEAPAGRTRGTGAVG
jgi:hypothetical protein